MEKATGKVISFETFRLKDREAAKLVRNDLEIFGLNQQIDQLIGVGVTVSYMMSMYLDHAQKVKGFNDVGMKKAYRDKMISLYRGYEEATGDVVLPDNLRGE